MYIWVVLATFIAILYGFNLSVRSDMRQIYVEPQAEAAVSKIVLQHRAAEKFFNDKVAQHIGYSSGRVNVQTFEDFLPVGFDPNYDDDGKTYYITTMYCLDKNSDKLSAAAASCNAENSLNYLITYGCVPQRWKSIKGGRPANDLVNAMRRVTGRGSNFGYTQLVEADAEKNDLGTEIGINTGNNQWLSVPQYIISQSGTLGDESFASMCGLDGACAYCMAYMTPYEQL